MLKEFILRRWKTALWLVVVALVMTVIEAWGNERTIRVHILVGTFTVLMWQLLWLGNEFASCWLDAKIHWHEKPLKRLFVGIAVMTVYTIGAIYFLISLYRLVFHFDVGNDLGGMLNVAVIFTLLISMFMTGRTFLVNWRQAAVDAERLKRESVKAQYESLKSQVNPHFLFNSLNALTNLVYEDQDKAARFIKQLSEVYRYVLDTREKELVALEEELRFVNSYLYLQKIRFDNNLRVHLNLHGANGKVAPLALQLLLENAIKHNIISKDEPLTINIYQEEGYIVIENNIQHKTMTSENGTGMGLANIRNRYKFLSDKEVLVEDKDGKFMVKIPTIQTEEA